MSPGYHGSARIGETTLAVGTRTRHVAWTRSAIIVRKAPAAAISPAPQASRPEIVKRPSTSSRISRARAAASRRAPIRLRHVASPRSRRHPQSEPSGSRRERHHKWSALAVDPKQDDLPDHNRILSPARASEWTVRPFAGVAQDHLDGVDGASVTNLLLCRRFGLAARSVVRASARGAWAPGHDWQ